MKYLFSKRNLSIALLLVLTMAGYRLQGQELDRPPAVDEVNYTPMDGEVLATNPPAFIWLPVKGVNSYIVQYSRSQSSCQNAFVVEAYGEPLAISTGSRQLYGSPHHSEWMWHTKAHNSILVDNEGQVIRNRSSRGEIISYEENGDYVYAAGDATQAYGGRLERFQRYIMYIRPNYVVIIDDLKTSGKSSTFQWLLHSPAEIRINRENHVMVNQSGDVRLTTRLLIPHDLVYKQHTGFTPQVEDSTLMYNQFHLTVSATEPAKSKRFVTVMCIDRTIGSSVKKPSPPSTPRKELTIRGIEDMSSLDKVLSKAELLKAEGGIAIRLGDDLILWREQDALQVSVAGTVSTRKMEIRKKFFIGR